MATSNIFKSHLIMASWSVLIATSFPAAALVANTIDATSLTALRFLVAAILFYPMVVRSGDASLPKLEELLAYGMLAGISVFYFWALFKALETTTPLNTSAIFTLIPAFTALAAYFISREVINGKVLLALIIGSIGSIWMVVKGDMQTVINFAINDGDTLFFLGCIALSLYSPLIILMRRKLSLTRSPIYITFWVLVLGTIFLLAIALYEQRGDLGWNQLGYLDYSVVLYLAIFTTVITFWQLQHCTPILGSVVVMSYTYTIPGILLIADQLLFGVSFGVTIYIGAGLTLSSIMILNFCIGMFESKKV
ncbi:MAG: hypothetical protein FD130_272 [Halothiobacillaceae bacterium]|nr:MAG: hypothetical protein FD130_272 [Halothiobacillaceae bacterium]